MGTLDYMHKSGVRYRHAYGQPEVLYYYDTPAPPEVDRDWQEYRETQHVEFLAWCERKGFNPTTLESINS